MTELYLIKIMMTKLISKKNIELKGNKGGQRAKGIYKQNFLQKKNIFIKSGFK